jgi:hypothetical protein
MISFSPLPKSFGGVRRKVLTLLRAPVTLLARFFPERHVSDTPLQVSHVQPSPAETPSVGEVLGEIAKQSLWKVLDYTGWPTGSLSNLVRPPHHGPDTLGQMDDIGVGSLRIILLSDFFIGTVVLLQTGFLRKLALYLADKL